MESIKFKTVDEYFESIPSQAVERMKTIRKEIKKTASLAEEVISYNMPALKYKGILVYYAAYEKHIGFYPTPDTITAFKKQHGDFQTAKGSVKFPHDIPLPLELIKKMTKYRYEEKLKEK